MVSPVHGDYRRCQAEIPLIILCRFPGPALPSQVSPIGFEVESRRERRIGARLIQKVRAAIASAAASSDSARDFLARSPRG